ncbi:MAG: histidine kinase dimerization/phosphoacceptor domain -containing protein [Chthoniobacteraceae bacterium]
MLDFFRLLFDTTDFPQRWHCGGWSPAHGWLHIVSDTLIFGAYAAIPGAIAFFAMRRRQDIVFPKLWWLFAAFIFSCGFGHLIEATLFWQPWYRLSGSVKAITAIVSWATVLSLVRYLPDALSVPGAAQLNAKLQREIDERRRAEEQVRHLNAALESRVQELETLLEVLPIGIGIAKDSQCRDIRTNKAFSEILGIVPGRNASLSAPPAEAPREFKVMREGRELTPDELPIQRAASEGVIIRNFEERIERVDGSRIDLLCHAAPIRSQDGSCRGAVGVFVDITERKAAEEKLKASLEEKKVLLHEIHHRVKNNLQFIISLLRLQGGESSDPALREMLDETRSRVHAMALVHEKLYRADDLSRLDYGSYLRELIAALARGMRERVAKVEFAISSEAVGLQASAAVPVGLVVNELVSNSLKHAFRDGRDGRIEVNLRGSPEHGYALAVRDNGVGAPGEFDPAATRSMGWRLVEMLVRQLDGTIAMTREGGTEFAIHFWPRHES